MQMTFTEDEPRRFLLIDARHRVALSAGFVYDTRLREWHTTSARVAVRLREYADEAAKREIERTFIQVSPWTAAIPYPEHLTPEPYQLDSARHALSRNRSYQGLDPGLGKSIVAALVLNALPDAKAIFFVPPFLVFNIQAEIHKWDTNARVVEIHGQDLWDYAPDVLIIPDSVLDRPIVAMKIQQMRAATKHLVMFYDEAHRLKNPEAIRTRAFLGDKRRASAQKKLPDEGYFRHADRVVFLSGTPMPNRSLELFPILSSAAPETIGFRTFFEYGKRYCGGRHNGFGWDFKFDSNTKELARAVIPHFMLRLKKSVLDLPPKIEEAVILADNVPPKLAQLEREILKEAGSSDLMAHLASNGHVSTYRKELGILKCELALPFLKSILEETEEAILVFAIHKEVVADLRDGLAAFDPLVIDGSVEATKRQAIANEFNSDSRRRVLILNIQAGGVGFNLTKASRVVLVEFSWCDADNSQAVDRAFRYGQTKTVLAQYLLYKNSIDRAVYETLLRKRKVTSNV